MTVTAATVSSTDLLAARLTSLRAERDQVQAETMRESTGDIADRATNVEATIRLSLLDERIAAVENELDASRTLAHTDGVVSVGDVVTLDFGDGPETYLVGSVEQVASGVDTVTPNSPLGRAIVGAPVGSTVRYSPRAGLTLEATIVAS